MTIALGPIASEEAHEPAKAWDRHKGPHYDLVALGEVMLRLDPGDQRVRSTRSFNVWEGGGEYNVARGLQRSFGQKTAILTSLVDNDVGRLIEDLIRQGGVDSSWISWHPFDGIGFSARNGLNFTERGFGLREPIGVSDRGHTAASQLSADQFDQNWSQLFSKWGTRWFHTGGIFAGLSKQTLQCAERALFIAKEYGAMVSYDLNYRPSLWQSRGGLGGAREANRRLAPMIDILIGNEGHLRSVLAQHLPTQDPSPKGSWEISHKNLCEGLREEFPQLKGIAMTCRTPTHANLHHWSGTLWYEGGWYESRIYHTPIYDRVGGGDSFASGLIYGLINQMDPMKALEFAVAHGALAMTTPGDHSMVNFHEVEKLVRGDSISIER